MKILFWILLSLMHLLSIHKAISADLAYFPQIKETASNPFYPVNGKFLIVEPSFEKFKNIFENNNPKSKWITLPTQEMSHLGLKEGDVIKSLPFGDEGQYSYTLGKNVIVVLMENFWYGDVPNQTKYNAFYILLNNNRIGFSEPQYEGGADNVTGIAYKAGDYEFVQEKKFIEPKYIPTIFDENVLRMIEGYNKDKSRPYFKAQEVSKFEFKNFTFYSLSGEITFTSDGKSYPDKVKAVLMFDNLLKKQFILPGSFSTFEKGGDLDFKISDAIKGADWIMFKTGTVMHECGNIYIYTNGEIKAFNLECDSGGC